MTHDKRYLFYVDSDNYLRDVYQDSGTWYCGNLHKTLNLKCAPYGKLAACKYNNGAADFIYLYFQDSDDSGNIRICSLSHEGWYVLIEFLVLRRSSDGRLHIFLRLL